MENLNLRNNKLKKGKTTKKKVEGITLIALVVTIIVLLILAGVTIATLTGDNGILNKAQKAKEKTETATDEEQRKMAMYEATTNTENTEFQGITIPAGFAPTRIEGESTVDEGLVITDSYGNEFVWVPVPYAILGDEGHQEEITNLSYTPMAEKIKETENYRGILYDFAKYDIDEKKVQIITYDEEGNREPSLITRNENGEEENYDKYNYQKAGDFKNETEFLEQMQNDYNEMVESVKNYGGFYIARYEISYENENVQYQKGKQSYYNHEYEKEHWYGYYRKQREFANNNAYENSVKSSMLWGSQYDAMMNWMARNEIDVTDSNIDDKKNKSRITGDVESDKILNVYDLLGNSWEWTLEARSTNYRELRGSCYDNGSTLCGRGIASNPKIANFHHCSRATLYIIK